MRLITMLIRRTAGQCGVQGRRQGVDVGGFGAAAASGQHFRRGPWHGETGLGSRLIHIRGDAEIGEHRQSLRGDEDVRGLDVAVQDAFAVRGEQGAAKFDAQVEHLVGGEWSLADQLLIGAAGRVFQHDVAKSGAGHAGVVDGKDVGVRGKLRHVVRLIAESGGCAGVEGGAADLDGDVAAGDALVVPVYAGCGAGAEWLDEIIAGYPRRCWLCRHLAIPLTTSLLLSLFRGVPTHNP